ncbi:hypothetical protein SNEBB_007271 [Seison nebaliae]|nr:hypothetical protein SNEBB_007271 [Seison nebaliae]
MNMPTELENRIHRKQKPRVDDTGFGQLAFPQHLNRYNVEDEHKKIWERLCQRNYKGIQNKPNDRHNTSPSGPPRRDGQNPNSNVSQTEFSRTNRIPIVERRDQRGKSSRPAHNLQPRNNPVDPVPSRMPSRRLSHNPFANNRSINPRWYLAPKLKQKYYEISKEELRILDDPCSICYDKFSYNGKVTVVKLSKCHHCFHKTCIDTWFKNDKKTCPICRLSV